MVKASKHRYANYDCRIGRRGERWLGGQALSDPLVRPCDVEIVEAVLLQHVLDVPLAEDDDVIETVAPDAAEKPLANGIHERSLNGRPKNADAGALRGAVEVGTELTVVVSDDELGPDAEGSSLPHLLCRPLRGRVPRNANMNDLLCIDVHDEEREDLTKPNVVYLEKIVGPHGVIAQERVPVLPARRRRIPTIAHVPLHGALRDVDSELDKLATNALGAPEPILGGHALNELDDKYDILDANLIESISRKRLG
jgi:hypothetical protein